MVKARTKTAASTCSLGKILQSTKKKRKVEVRPARTVYCRKCRRSSFRGRI